MIFHKDYRKVGSNGSPFRFVWSSMRGAHEDDSNCLLFDGSNSWLADDRFSWFRVGNAKCLLLTKRKWARGFAKDDNDTTLESTTRKRRGQENGCTLHLWRQSLPDYVQQTQSAVLSALISAWHLVATLIDTYFFRGSPLNRDVLKQLLRMVEDGRLARLVEEIDDLCIVAPLRPSYEHTGC